jgi:hypothetical protein
MANDYLSRRAILLSRGLTDSETAHCGFFPGSHSQLTVALLDYRTSTFLKHKHGINCRLGSFLEHAVSDPVGIVLYGRLHSAIFGDESNRPKFGSRGN